MELKYLLLFVLIVVTLIAWRQTAKSLDRVEDLLKELSDTTKKL